MVSEMEMDIEEYWKKFAKDVLGPPKFTEKEIKPVIMPARLHEADLTSFSLEGDIGYEYLVLPENMDVYGKPPLTDAVDTLCRTLGVPKRIFQPTGLSPVELKVRYDPEGLLRPWKEKTKVTINMGPMFLFPLGKTWQIVETKIEFHGHISGFKPNSDNEGEEPTATIEVTPCES